MCASRRWAIWPQVVAISLIALGAASCSDTERFSSLVDTDSTARSNNAGSIPQGGPVAAGDSGSVVGKPMPPIAAAGGSGMASGRSEITGSVQSPSGDWTWEGGTPIVVGRGETLDTLSRKYAVPAAAIAQVNGLTRGGAIRAGEHLVIPRRRSSISSREEPRHRAARAEPPSPNDKLSRAGSAVHVVAPGETLYSIARRYGKSVTVLARASNVAPDTVLRVGQYVVIPDARRSKRAEAKPPKAPPAPKRAAKHEAPHREVAAADDPPHSAFKASSEAPKAQPAPVVKVAAPAAALPRFRWPVRGRIITGFGPKPNGLQNDGIDLAVPQGTPVKAADDGVVAYAGNELKGYGNLVLIRHDNGYVTAYAHASKILVRRGETVKRGQVIAKSGETGSVKSPELHFEIRKGPTPVDPAQFLNGA